MNSFQLQTFETETPLREALTGYERVQNVLKKRKTSLIQEVSIGVFQANSRENLQAPNQNQVLLQTLLKMNNQSLDKLLKIDLTPEKKEKYFDKIREIRSGIFKQDFYCKGRFWDYFLNSPEYQKKLIKHINKLGPLSFIDGFDFSKEIIGILRFYGPEITSLFIENSKFSDELCKSLEENCKALGTLKIVSLPSQSRLKINQGWNSLKKLPLKKMDFQSFEITDSDLVAIANLPFLQELNFRNSFIREKDLPFLRRLDKLEKIQISNSSREEKELNEIVKNLPSHLSWIRVFGFESDLRLPGVNQTVETTIRNALKNSLREKKLVLELVGKNLSQSQFLFEF